MTPRQVAAHDALRDALVEMHAAWQEDETEGTEGYYLVHHITVAAFTSPRDPADAAFMLVHPPLQADYVNEGLLRRGLRLNLEDAEES